MSTSAGDFKKLKRFWQSQEEKNLARSESCVSQSNRLQANITKDLESGEEKELSPVSNDEFNQESLYKQSEVPQFTAELLLEFPPPNHVILITDVDLSSSEASGRSKLIQFQCNESNNWHLIDDNPVTDECFDQNLRSQLLSPDSINYDSLSVSSYAISNDGYDMSSIESESFHSNPSAELSSDIKTSKEENTEVNFIDEDWLGLKTHIFVLSYAGKPIFSLNKLGPEEMKMFFSDFSMKCCCLISHFEFDRNDRILSIEGEGIKFVFFLLKTMYLVAVSRENLSEYHLRLQLKELYNRIGFLLTLGSLDSILEASPKFDVRPQLRQDFNLISNQLTNNMTISNNIFTLFTDTVRVLPLHPTSRETITSIIQKSCSKISNLVFAILIVDDQLVALVKSVNNTIYSADIRLIMNLMQCPKNIMNIYYGWTLPLCLPNFNKQFYLHAHISCISKECEAFLILLSYNNDTNEELSQAHRDITKTLHEHNWRKTICRQISNGSKEGNGFNVDVINIPELWHFLYMPKSSNRQLLCSKINPPYTCMSEFKRLETIYRDLHNRIHHKTRPLQLILEKKDKEVALAMKTNEAEIYAVFDPMVNTISAANHYINELIRRIQKDRKAHFIRRYPSF